MSAIAEKCLLIAVRDRLRAQCGYADEVCEIEYDEELPGTVGETYVAVVPAGWSPAARQNSSGTVCDLVYAVSVAVVKRIRATPRDRRRNVFLHNFDNLSEELDRVHLAIDWQYAVMNAANALIIEETGSTFGFEEPLRFASVDRKPRLVSPEIFAATGQQAAGMVRTITFGGARRTTEIIR